MKKQGSIVNKNKKKLPLKKEKKITIQPQNDFARRMEMTYQPKVKQIIQTPAPK